MYDFNLIKARLETAEMALTNTEETPQTINDRLFSQFAHCVNVAETIRVNTDDLKVPNTGDFDADNAQIYKDILTVLNRIEKRVAELSEEQAKGTKK